MPRLDTAGCPQLMLPCLANIHHLSSCRGLCSRLGQEAGTRLADIQETRYIQDEVDLGIQSIGVGPAGSAPNRVCILHSHGLFRLVGGGKRRACALLPLTVATRSSTGPGGEGGLWLGTGLQKASTWQQATIVRPVLPILYPSFIPLGYSYWNSVQIRTLHDAFSSSAAPMLLAAYIPGQD